MLTRRSTCQTRTCFSDPGDEGPPSPSVEVVGEDSATASHEVEVKSSDCFGRRRGSCEYDGAKNEADARRSLLFSRRRWGASCTQQINPNRLFVVGQTFSSLQYAIQTRVVRGSRKDDRCVRPIDGNKCWSISAFEFLILHTFFGTSNFGKMQQCNLLLLLYFASVQGEMRPQRLRVCITFFKGGA